MAVALLYFILAARRFLRAEHVCGGGGGELPQMSSRVGEGGEGCQSHQESSQD